MKDQSEPSIRFDANGFYYRKKDGSFTRKIPVIVDPVGKVESRLIDPEDSISTKTASDATDEESFDFVKKLNSNAKKVSFFKVFGKYPVFLIAVLITYNLFKTVYLREDVEVTFRITADNVNVRKLPSPKGAIKFRSNRGDRLPLLQDLGDWVKVKLGNDSGYISKDLGSIKTKKKVIERRRYYQDAGHLEILVPLIASLLIAWLVWLYFLDKKRFSIFHYYQMDEKIVSLHEKFIASFSELGKSKKVWQYLHKSFNTDLKRSSGAGTSVRRIEIEGISLNRLPGRFFKTNVVVPSIKLKYSEIFFFPERILVKIGNDFGSSFYRNILTKSKSVLFLEDEEVPEDAIISEYVWRFQNKDGSPDLRFKDNSKIPYCDYSQYTFESKTGINEVIVTSRKGCLDNFITFIGKIRQFQNENHA